MKKLLLVATSLFLLNTSPASACSCLPTTPQQSLDRSSTVFSGKVIDIVQPNPRNTTYSTPADSQVKVKFEVAKVWKGKTGRQLIVTTSDSSASCGYSFQKGEAYLVYASSQDGKVETGLCSGTKPLSQARADLAVLGNRETPTVERANTTPVELQRNRRKWINQNISSYRYTLRVRCFCNPQVTQPVVIEVRNGKVTSIVAANTRKSVNPEPFKNYDTIPDLFNLARTAISKNASRLVVTYHPTLGYPTQMSIDYSDRIADDEISFTIEKFEVIK